MNKKENGITLLSLIDKMRECRRKQNTFRKEKNTENYKAMLASEESLDCLLKSVRAFVTAQEEERNIEIAPCQEVSI